MKLSIITSTLLSTSALAFPFFGNNQPHDSAVEARDQNHGFMGIQWPTFPRPTATVTATSYYLYPTPTPTPGDQYPPYFTTPTPGYATPTPTPGHGGKPWDNTDRLIFWRFNDARGRTFYVYCKPGKVINTRWIGAKGGPFICGKYSGN